MIKFWLCLLAAMAVMGCSSGGNNIETARECILRADREFSQLSEKQGTLAAFGAFMGDSATIYRNRQDPIRGREAILALYPSAEDQQGTLKWEPFFADIGKSGDLGYTLGKWTFYAPDSLGQEQALGIGYYVTIWKKQPDGSWKYVFDSGVSGPTEESKPKLPE